MVLEHFRLQVCLAFVVHIVFLLYGATVDRHHLEELLAIPTLQPHKLLAVGPGTTREGSSSG